MQETPQTIADFFRAMQAGSAAAHDIEALFSDDAVYVEPFSGTPTTHSGKAAIMAAMRQGWATPLPDMTISLDRVDVTDARVIVAWTCRSSGLPGGQGAASTNSR
ncbi:MAG: nuclear transport factor 2 family protein [Hyphomonadaceae bacterium]